MFKKVTWGRMTFQVRHGWMGGSMEALGEVLRTFDGVGQKFIFVDCGCYGGDGKRRRQRPMAQVVPKKEGNAKK